MALTAVNGKNSKQPIFRSDVNQGAAHEEPASPSSDPLPAERWPVMQSGGFRSGNLQQLVHRSEPVHIFKCMVRLTFDLVVLAPEILESRRKIGELYE